MRVAAVQMTSTPDVAENMSQIHHYLLEALQRGADLVAFPENCTWINESKTPYDPAIHLMNIKIFREWAAEHNIWILVGSLPLRSGKSKKLFNTSMLFASDGSVASSYQKMHLFDADLPGHRSYRESARFGYGKKVVTYKSPWAKLGLSICYDLRFPELYRRMQAEVIFIPSAFTVPTGQAHWDVLTRARAIENQAYVVAPAQVGKNYEGRETFGHSRIIDPWGRILSEQISGTGLIWADLDFDKLKDIRRDLPALKHRRLRN